MWKTWTPNSVFCSGNEDSPTIEIDTISSTRLKLPSSGIKIDSQFQPYLFNILATQLAPFILFYEEQTNLLDDLIFLFSPYKLINVFNFYKRMINCMHKCNTNDLHFE